MQNTSLLRAVSLIKSRLQSKSDDTGVLFIPVVMQLHRVAAESLHLYSQSHRLHSRLIYIMYIAIGHKTMSVFRTFITEAFHTINTQVYIQSVYRFYLSLHWDECAEQAAERKL